MDKSDLDVISGSLDSLLKDPIEVLTGESVCLRLLVDLGLDIVEFGREGVLLAKQVFLENLGDCLDCDVQVIQGA